MTAKQLPGQYSPDGSLYITLTDGAGNLATTSGSGTPGGSNTQVQYNNSTAFGGISGATTDGTTLTLVAPVLGAATGTSLALGGATLGAAALAWTGTAVGSSSITAASFLPTSNTIPSCGLFLNSAGAIGISSSSSLTFVFGGTAFANANTHGAQISHVSAAANTPTLIPDKTSTTTGIGAQATGNLSLIHAGSEILRSATGGPIVQPGQGTPAGGSSGWGLKFGTTTNLGIFFGSGAPTLSAAQGSLYLRSDGGATTRAYINTDGSSTWTALVSVG